MFTTRYWDVSSCVSFPYVVLCGSGRAGARELWIRGVMIIWDTSRNYQLAIVQVLNLAIPSNCVVYPFGLTTLRHCETDGWKKPEWVTRHHEILRQVSVVILDHDAKIRSDVYYMMVTSRSSWRCPGIP